MLTWFRAGFTAALLVFVFAPATAADKIFQDDALADAAITLEADLKNESGTVELPVIKLKEQAAVQLRRQDLESAAFTYGQIVTVSPDDSLAWRRLADLWLAIPADESDDGSLRFSNARTAAYIAYQRATTPQSEAAALTTLATAYGKNGDWRPALNASSLPSRSRPIAGVRRPMTSCARNTAFASPISPSIPTPLPRAPASSSAETLLKRADFSPFVSVVGRGQAGALG